MDRYQGRGMLEAILGCWQTPQVHNCLQETTSVFWYKDLHNLAGALNLCTFFFVPWVSREIYKLILAAGNYFCLEQEPTNNSIGTTAAQSLLYNPPISGREMFLFCNSIPLWYVATWRSRIICPLSCQPRNKTIDISQEITSSTNLSKPFSRAHEFTRRF